MLMRAWKPRVRWDGHIPTTGPRERQFGDLGRRELLHAGGRKWATRLYRL